MTPAFDITLKIHTSHHFIEKILGSIARVKISARKHQYLQVQCKLTKVLLFSSTKNSEIRKSLSRSPQLLAWISSDYFELLLLPQMRGENDSKQSDEIQATQLHLGSKLLSISLSRTLSLTNCDWPLLNFSTNSLQPNIILKRNKNFLNHLPLLLGTILFLSYILCQEY